MIFAHFGKAGVDGIDLALGFDFRADGAGGDQSALVPGKFIVAEAAGNGDDRGNEAELGIEVFIDAGGEGDDYVGIGRCHQFGVDVAGKDDGFARQQRLAPRRGGRGKLVAPFAHDDGGDPELEQVADATVIEAGDALGSGLDDCRAELVLDGDREFLGEGRCSHGECQDGGEQA